MIVLDTHALIWWVNSDKQLSSKARRAIEREYREGDGILVSAISAWEIAMLVEWGRLALAMDIEEWLATVASIQGVNFVSIDVETAVRCVRLPGVFHADRADRLIVALARRHSVPLVTADTKIRAYRHVRTIW